jgi:LPXTG-site transpeptidase (sortase) family protein
VLIGEILTYSIRIDIPVGTIANLKAVDVLDHGLAFVGCDPTTPISSGSLVLAQNPCTTPSALTVQAEPVTDTDPNSVEAGRRITFDFGTVQNNSAITQSLVLNYLVIVLDIADNVDGVTGLNNQVEWQWSGGTLSGAASGVNIVEPQLTIEKTVDPLFAELGSIVIYKVDISHTSASTAMAFDVLMTDSLPAGLALIPTSITVNNSAGLPAATVTTTATQLNVFWGSFPVGETATVTFQATFVGPGPVINTANVDWSSLQIDPNPHLVPQSPFNVHSTERRYDPPSQTLNDYRNSSSATLQAPARLPDTGFVPNAITRLPAQPHDMLYTATDVMLEIPGLGPKLPIVGVPKKNGTWDVTWLGKQAGWLEGSAFPSWSGNSVLTSHVYGSNGLPGPFVNLSKLKFGDQIIVHAYGQKYIFEVQTNQVVAPNDASAFKHEEKSWLTLITCKEYDEKTNLYRKRVLVRAVLVKVVWDK